MQAARDRRPPVVAFCGTKLTMHWQIWILALWILPPRMRSCPVSEGIGQNFLDHENLQLIIGFPIQGRAKKFLLSSVTHVPSGLMGCASAALSWWVAGRREIQTWRNFFCSSLYSIFPLPPTVDIPCEWPGTSTFINAMVKW